MEAGPPPIPTLTTPYFNDALSGLELFVFDDGGATTLDGEATSVKVSDVSAAPEPSAWMLMIAGVAMIGEMLRLRRSQMGALTGA